MIVHSFLADACATVFRRQSLSHSIAALAIVVSMNAASAQTKLPDDVDIKACSVSAAEFNSWFVGGQVKKDQIVLPANSIAFNAAKDDRCPFYKWSEQMFLWLVSPLTSGKHVFEESQFFSVGTGNVRELFPQGAKPLDFAPSISLVGGQGQEVVFDSAGKRHNVVRVDALESGNRLLRDQNDDLKEVGRISASASGRPLFFDQSDRPIDLKLNSAGARLLQDTSGKITELSDTTVRVNGVPRATTTTGDVVEFGQAGGNAALMTRDNALVYYLIQINDVFAYFKTEDANKKPKPTATFFPTTADEVKAISDFAAQAPAPFTRPILNDEIALAMEIKSSWIDAKTIPEVRRKDFLIIKATIPTFTQSGPDKLVRGAPIAADLALVGMHVVGSTTGHPEMIWASFEHIDNAPNRAYTYIDKSGVTVPKLADGAGPWLFSKTGAAETTPPPRMIVDPANPDVIKATGSTGTGPTDVTRLNPWGIDPADASANVINTGVIAINKSVIDLLPVGDVRRNYIMIGSTWTRNGKSPDEDEIFGTPGLANSTMETFKQPGNCFDCHSGGMLSGLSHIWRPIKPLFPPKP